MYLNDVKKLKVNDKLFYKFGKHDPSESVRCTVDTKPGSTGVYIILDEPIEQYKKGERIIAGFDELSDKQCNVCGRWNYWETIEIFGKLRGIQLGCAACIGIEHHPNWRLLNFMFYVLPNILMFTLIAILLGFYHAMS